ncbi:hypothetical protein H2203_001830 [Taxawa tesnikishii (nom. ined.)]|nr:hypothetical protein H2203_001830 [Dothideales sp. JES 119]
MRCNCSICTKSGYLLVYPFQRDFRWTRGEDKIKSYYFGAKTKAQWFCGECGSSIGIDLTSLGEVHGGTKYGINVSLFKDIDTSTLKYKQGNGRDILGPHYKIDE